MNELIEYAQLIMNYLQTNGANLNQESQQALGEFLQTILQIIEMQGQQGGTLPPAPTLPIPAGMPSSNVAGMDYNDKTGELLVQFLGKHPNRQGAVYSYPDTPKVIAELIQAGAIPARTKGQNAWGKWWPGKVPSAGASVFSLLKNRNVPYQRVS